MKPRDRIVTVDIECVELPPAHWDGDAEIWLGIQKGKEVVQEVKLPADSVRFTAELRVGPDSPHSGPNFLGPYAQGPVQERFIYLCWGSRHAGHWVGFRRVKLPLIGLTWESIASDRLRATLRCTDSKGGPVCATVRSEYLSWSPG